MAAFGPPQVAGSCWELDPSTLQIIGRFGNSLSPTLGYNPSTGLYVSWGAASRPSTRSRTSFGHFSNVRVEDLAIAPDGTLWGTSWPQRGNIMSFDSHGAAQIQLALPADVIRSPSGARVRRFRIAVRLLAHPLLGQQ